MCYQRTYHHVHSEFIHLTFSIRCSDHILKPCVWPIYLSISCLSSKDSFQVCQDNLSHQHDLPQQNYLPPRNKLFHQHNLICHFSWNEYLSTSCIFILQQQARIKSWIQKFGKTTQLCLDLTSQMSWMITVLKIHFIRSILFLLPNIRYHFYLVPLYLKVKYIYEIVIVIEYSFNTSLCMMIIHP